MISWGKHKDLLANAVSLIATTGLTSVLGFAYWNIAARLFSQQAVGYGAAAVSVMTLLSSIGVFGLSTLLIGSLPGRTSNRTGLIWAATFAAAFGSLILTLAFILVAPYFSTHFNNLIGSATARGPTLRRGCSYHSVSRIRFCSNRLAARRAAAGAKHGILGRENADLDRRCCCPAL